MNDRRTAAGGQPALIRQLLDGDDDVILTPEQTAYLSAYLRRGYSFGDVQAEKRAYGHSPIYDAHQHLKTILRYNRELQQQQQQQQPPAAQTPPAVLYTMPVPTATPGTSPTATLVADTAASRQETTPEPEPTPEPTPADGTLAIDRIWLDGQQYRLTDQLREFLAYLLQAAPVHLDIVAVRMGWSNREHVHSRIGALNTVIAKQMADAPRRPLVNVEDLRVVITWKSSENHRR